MSETSIDPKRIENWTWRQWLWIFGGIGAVWAVGFALFWGFVYTMIYKDLIFPREPVQAITEDIQLIKDRGQRYRATRAFYNDLTFPLLHVRGFLPPHFNGTGEGANPWGGDYIIEPSRDGTKLVVIATFIPDEVKDQLTQAIGIDTACSAVPGVGEDLDQCTANLPFGVELRGVDADGHWGDGTWAHLFY